MKVRVGVLTAAGACLGALGVRYGGVLGGVLGGMSVLSWLGAVWCAARTGRQGERRN
jgi:hypothetical protein